LAGIGDLPAHTGHQEEAEKKEDERGDPVLDADHLVVAGEDVFLPEPRFVVMLVVGVSVGDVVCCGRCLHVQKLAGFRV